MLAYVRTYGVDALITRGVEHLRPEPVPGEVAAALRHERARGRAAAALRRRPAAARLALRRGSLRRDRARAARGRGRARSTTSAAARSARTSRSRVAILELTGADRVADPPGRRPPRPRPPLRARHVEAARRSAGAAAGRSSGGLAGDGRAGTASIATGGSRSSRATTARTTSASTPPASAPEPARLRGRLSRSRCGVCTGTRPGATCIPAERFPRCRRAAVAEACLHRTDVRRGAGPCPVGAGGALLGGAVVSRRPLLLSSSPVVRSRRPSRPAATVRRRTDDPAPTTARRRTTAHRPADDDPAAATAAALASASAASTLVFTGHGWGHGIGMSQWGAYGYAQHGWSYRRILAHYYPGHDARQPPVVRPFGSCSSRRQPKIALESTLAVAVVDGSGAKVALPAGTARGAGVARGRRAEAACRRSPSRPAARRSSSDGKPYRGTLAIVADRQASSRSVNTLAARGVRRGRRRLRGAVELAGRRRSRRRRSRPAPTRSPTLGPATAARRSTSTRDTRSQVYGGIAAETPAANAAVAATAHQVVLYGGKVATTLLLVELGRPTVSAAEVDRHAGSVPRLGAGPVRHALAVPRLGPGR